jgi:hypothetical protein
MMMSPYTFDEGISFWRFILIFLDFTFVLDMIFFTFKTRPREICLDIVELIIFAGSVAYIVYIARFERLFMLLIKSFSLRFIFEFRKISLS